MFWIWLGFHSLFQFGWGCSYWFHKCIVHGAEEQQASPWCLSDNFLQSEFLWQRENPYLHNMHTHEFVPALNWCHMMMSDSECCHVLYFIALHLTSTPFLYASAHTWQFIFVVPGNYHPWICYNIWAFTLTAYCASTFGCVLPKPWTFFLHCSYSFSGSLNQY